MEITTDDRCFVCGKNNKNGLGLEIIRDDAAKKAFATTTVDDKFCGWSGIVHGGIITSLLDEIMAHAAFAYSNQTVVTGEIKIRFKKPIPTNSEILVEGNVKSQQRRILYTVGTITMNGEVMAEATAKMVLQK